jgi:hypothetical protein
MSFSAIVINAMIASPGDIQAERTIAREVMYEWNTIHSDTRKMVLHPTGWETHSAPAMGARPQEIINSQILKSSDLLVAIFWTRIGTPTGKSVSGTVEEIEEHVSAGKLAMVYFSSAPVHPDSVDQVQYQNLKEFKVLCRGKGLFESYDSHAEFREKFSRQLSMHINRHPFFVALSKDHSSDTPGEFSSHTPLIPSINNESKILLKEASQDPHGVIYKLAYIGGFDIQTNGKQFVEIGNPRSRAIWEEAVSDLIRFDLLESRGSKDEIFGVTALGYQIADLL